MEMSVQALKGTYVGELISRHGYKLVWRRFYSFWRRLDLIYRRLSLLTSVTQQPHSTNPISFSKKI